MAGLGMLGIFGPKTYQLSDVFGPAKEEIPRNYVSRESVDDTLATALRGNRHIVIHGSSKQGKTSLRKSVLPRGGYTHVMCSDTWTLDQLHGQILKSAKVRTERSTTQAAGGGFKVNAFVGAAGKFSKETTTAPLQIDLEDVNDIISALNAANAPRLVVLEDFHYLPEDTQKRFSIALKAFHENSPYIFVVIGVWLDENRLLHFNGDLTGRMVSISADRWESEDLRKVVASGEKLLNVEFVPSFVTGLIEGAYESVWIVQQVCELACTDAGVLQTAKKRRSVDGDVDGLVRHVIEKSGARFDLIMTMVADGINPAILQMYSWLLYAILRSDVASLEKGIFFREVYEIIKAVHPQKPLHQHNVTQALRSLSTLQNRRGVKPHVLSYDESAQRLHIVDRSFLIWLEQQQPAELAEKLQLPVQARRALTRSRK